MKNRTCRESSPASRNPLGKGLAESQGMAILWARREGPAHGPFADAWFDDKDGVYRIRLTGEGRLLAEDYLRRYPHPIRLLIATWPGAYRGARAARLSDEEIAVLCLEGVALAVARYDPHRGASLGTAIVWGVRAVITQAVRKAKRLVGQHDDWRSLASAERNGTERMERTVRNFHRITDRLAAPPDERLCELRSEELQQELSHYLKCSGLNARESRVLTMRFGLKGHPPLTSIAAGQALGISAERVRQIQERSLEKIRSAHGLDRDWKDAARQRILAFLRSVSAAHLAIVASACPAGPPGASKAEIIRCARVPLWQLRQLLPALVSEGLVVRERYQLSRGRSSAVYRARAAER